MSRSMMAAILATLLVFSCLSCNKRGAPTSATFAPDSVGVTILFGGLMVFHKENGMPSYEVGILGPDASPGHVFTVSVDGVVKDRQHLPSGGNWTLELTNSQAPAAFVLTEVGHSARHPDDVNGQYDFSWIIDLESSEFHGHELELKPQLLKPIIHLPGGKLYTRYKSVDLQRRQGNSSSSDFGFLPETTALDLQLHSGQELVLKDSSSSGPNGEIFRLSYSPSHPHYEVWILNTRPPEEGSDFRLYYNLFPSVQPEQQYDFSYAGSTLSPFNPFPTRTFHKTMMILPTVEGGPCTAVLLGKRSASLE